MKVKLQIVKDGALLFEGSYEISDAESFAWVFSDTWSKLRQAQFDKETSIGALMDHLDDDVLDQLTGAEIRLEKV